MRRRFTAFLCLVSLPGVILGMSPEVDNLRLNFQRGLDYYRWAVFSRADLTAGGQRFRTDEEISVMLRQPPGFPDYWKTSLKLNGNWDKPIGESVMFGGGVSTDIFYDQQVRQKPPFLLNSLYPGSYVFDPSGVSLTTGLNNRIYRQSAHLGINFLDFNDFEVGTRAGIYGERLMGSTGVGPSGGITLAGDSLEIGGFLTNISAGATGQFLRGRENRELTVDLRALREYSTETTNMFSAQYRSYMRQFPLSTGVSNRRKEDELRLGNSLVYKLASPASLILDLSLARRKVEPTSLDETNRLSQISTGLTAGLNYKLGRHRLRLSFGSESQNQEYPFRTVDGQQFNLRSGVLFLLGRDSLDLSGLLARNKYDVSPEDYSIDTRDELRHSYRLAYYHPFGGGLELASQLRVDLNHLVYLKAGRSADNNWERFFLFSPEVRYISGGFSHWARFRVSAKYIDYDFEQTAPPSRVFRKFSAEDSLRVVIDGQWSLRIQYLLLLEDQGGLDWERFVQDLSDEYRTHDGSLVIARRIRGLEWGVGWGFYYRKGYHADLPGERVQSGGPLVSLSGTGPLKSQVEFSASYRRVRETYRNPYNRTFIDFTIMKVF